MNREKKNTFKIKMHSANSSDGRIIWPEIWVTGKNVNNTAELKKAVSGEHVHIEWSLIGANGARTVLNPDDARIEKDGFLLRIPEYSIRKGIQAECALILDTDREFNRKKH